MADNNGVARSREAQSPTRGSLSTTLIIVLANVLVTALLLAVTTLHVLSDRQAAVERAYADADNLTSALAEHTGQTFAALDLAVATVVQDIQEQPAGAVDPLRLHTLLARLQKVSPASYAFFVLDAQGRLVSTSRTPAPEPVDLSNTPEFQAHVNEPRVGSMLGPPRKGRVGHAQDRWISNLTRRIEDADGQFAGMVGVSLSLNHLLGFYQRMRIGEHGVVSMFSADGLIVVRAPFDETHIGRDLSEGPLFRELLTEAASGHFTVAFPTDGRRRLTGFSRAAEDRAVVIVGLDEAEVLAPWWQRTRFQ